MSGKISEFSVVTVPFPFSDRSKTKRRPALVISSNRTFNNVIGHSVMAMITSSKNSPWPLDIEVKKLSEAGLPSPSVVRMKLFTIDHRLIQSVLGRLSREDISAVVKSFQLLFNTPARQ